MYESIYWYHLHNITNDISVYTGGQYDKGNVDELLIEVLIKECYGKIINLLVF